MVGGAGWFVTDVSGQRVVPSSGIKTFVLDIVTLQDGTDALSRNVGDKLIYTMQASCLDILTLEDGTDALFRNVGEKVTITTHQSSKVKISTPWQKPASV
jgi:hypothetical protein